MKSILLLFSFVLAGIANGQTASSKSRDSLFIEPYYCSQPIDANLFEREWMKIKLQHPDRRFAKAQNLAGRFCLSSVQVARLCMILPHYSDKLLLAKKCYANCTDKQQYEVVINTMKNAMMRFELAGYISQFGYGGFNMQASCCNVCHNLNNYNTPSMSSNDFAKAKEVLRQISFDNTRLETMKTMLNNNYFTTNQVIEIAELLVFEQNKLNWVKAAYRNTIDKNNYFRVSSIFDFDSSIAEVNNFINQYKA